MAPVGASKGEDKGISEIVQDLWQLLRDYARQETIDPLKAIKNFLGWGLLGAIGLGLGLFFCALAVLRALQTETGTALTGVWDWVPYAVSLLFCVVAVALSIRSIKKPFAGEEQRP